MFLVKKTLLIILSSLLFFISLPVFADAAYSGRVTDGSIVNVELGNVGSEYRIAWTNAYVRWNEVQDKRSFRYQAGASSTMTAVYDSADIQNNSNVRVSVASHELGHALGLADVTNQVSIMDTNRDRTTRIYPTTLDISRINNLY